MNKQPKNPLTEAELRRRAEAQLRNRARTGRSKAGARKRAVDARRLPHELQVHQVELEMQNAELREARDRMEVQLEKYTDLYDFAPVGYFSLNEEGRILEVNLAGAALLGVERSRLLNRRLAPYVVLPNQPMFLAFLEQVFAGTGKQACETALLRENAAPFWASLQGTSAISVSGPRKWCRLAVSDITSLKQAEDILRRNEALFASLVEQAPVGVYVVDGQLRMQQINPKALPVFSQIHPLIGRNLGEIMRILWPEKTAETIIRQFRHTLRTGQTYDAPDFSEQRRDIGVTQSYEWQLQRITLPTGQHGVVSFSTDITERKRAEAAQRRIEVLAASNQKLEQEIIRRQAVEDSLKESEQQQRQLLAQSRHMEDQLRHLSHQVLVVQEEERKRISRELHDVIAQTLTGINVHLAALKTNSGSNTRAIQRSIGRTQRLVEQSVRLVHHFARALRPAVLDDLGLIPALHAFMKGFKEETGVHVSLSAFAGVEQVSEEKRTVLYRVVQEALTNIARHARATRAAVQLRQLDGAISMTITDDGQGFETEHVVSSKKSYRLGLLGMKERLEMVGGNLMIESTPGKGTTIRTEIPFSSRVAGGDSSTPPAKAKL